MVRTTSSIRSHVEALAEREPAFAKVIEQHGIPQPRTSNRGVETLLRTIVGQQVSVAAARSMWAKLEAAFGSPPDLRLLLAANDEELRAAGMSRHKSSYLRSLAELVISGELDLDALPEDDEEAIALLTRIKGIGRWSAEIYLLFAEGRRDVFPAGDAFVMPTHAEGFGFVSVEAMSFGLPVVTSPVGAGREIVYQEGTGLLVAPGDVDALSRMMARLAGDAGASMRIGAAARAAFLSRFTRDRFRESLGDLYRRAMAA